MLDSLLSSWFTSPADTSDWVRLGLAGLGGALVATLLGWFRLRRSARHTKQLEARSAQLCQELEQSKRTLHDALAAIEDENFTDPLTDLRNRRYISAVIKSDVAKVMRAYRDSGPGLLPNQDLVFLMVDLDHFSRINEFYGQPTGDRILLAVSDALRRIVRETDAVIRWGGDEFLVVTRYASRRQAPEIAERIRSSLEGLSIESPRGEPLACTSSIGFAAYPFQIVESGWLAWDRVVEIADACLEVAKKSGRNAWVGVQAGDGLVRAKHGPHFPKGLAHLVAVGVLDVFSNREDPFGKTQKIGEILG